MSRTNKLAVLPFVCAGTTRMNKLYQKSSKRKKNQGKVMFTKRQWKNMGIILIISLLVTCLELALKPTALIYMLDDILMAFILSAFIKAVALNGIYIFACLIMNLIYQRHVGVQDQLIDTPILSFKEDNNVEP